MSRVRMMNQYLPPYEAVVKAGVDSVMSSFNLIDYIPATANKWMMTDVLRKQWGFNGFVVTDYASIAEILQHGTAKDIKEASEQALKAGTDMDMCSNAFVKHLAKSIAEGKVCPEIHIYAFFTAPCLVLAPAAFLCPVTFCSIVCFIDRLILKCYLHVSRPFLYSSQSPPVLNS